MSHTIVEKLNGIVFQFVLVVIRPKSENNAFEQSCIRKLLQMDIIDPLWTWNSAPEGAQYDLLLVRSGFEDFQLQINVQLVYHSRCTLHILDFIPVHIGTIY